MESYSRINFNSVLLIILAFRALSPVLFLWPLFIPLSRTPPPPYTLWFDILTHLRTPYCYAYFFFAPFLSLLILLPFLFFSRLPLYYLHDSYHHSYHESSFLYI